MDALVPDTLFTGTEVIAGHAVLIAEGCVVDVVPAAAVPGGAARTDLDGLLAPGFIDLQVNGGGGLLFNDAPTVETLRVVTATHRRFGTTGLLPTLITDAPEKRKRAIAAVRQARAEGVHGVMGLHFEGPFLNPLRKGVHDPSWMNTPTVAEAELLAAVDAGSILVTLAPECVPPPAIVRLVGHGVRVAAGHTAGSYDEIRAGMVAGVSGFTHLFNAMTSLTAREPGAVGAALDDPGSWCGIIVDGHHVHEALVRLAWRNKPERLFLVTDAMPPVGTKQDSFALYGRTIRVEEGRCVAEDGTLAGSTLDMATAVRNCVERVGIPLGAALAMASRIPAEYLGLGRHLGRIASGYRADLVLLDDTLRVRRTWIAGT